eukprot:CAMPEP_0113652624 /NCGR_PEP_ID=MMETSP0017_2-20120614/28112_1 /TAXON_ID=2856 /ORGANISM="Cylindrotheca closterium" /LENGTH=427 /DNA_ID=CAMNT_0000565497 /DNA_START=421 /DNA_END=1708 /DNA_ORIENTATION=+ /assembly_acc=CAM_ASM_000147
MTPCSMQESNDGYWPILFDFWPFVFATPNSFFHLRHAVKQERLLASIICQNRIANEYTSHGAPYGKPIATSAKAFGEKLVTLDEIRMEDAYPVLPGAMYTGDPVIVVSLNSPSAKFTEGEVKETRLDNAHKTAAISVLSERVGNLDTQLKSSRKDNLEVKKKLAILRTPESVVGGKRKNEEEEVDCRPSPKRLHYSDVLTVEEAAVEDAEQCQEAPDTKQASSGPDKQAPPPGVKRSVDTSLSCSQVENGAAGQGVTLGNCIAILHGHNSLLVDQMWCSTSIKDYFTNPSHLKHALSLADYVITDEQKEVLKNETSTRQQVMDTAMEIGFEAFKKLYELEGTTPEVAMKEKGGRAKMNYTGMGNRVKVYKQWMVEKMYPDTFKAYKGKRLLEVKFLERDKVATAAQRVADPTVPEKGRISSFFCRRK